MNFSAFLIAALILVIGYIPYKTKQRKKIIDLSWKYAALITLWFGIWIIFLIWQINNYIIVQFTPSIFFIFSVTTLLWLTSPILVRRWGKPPVAYFEKFPVHVLIRFQPSLYVAKYFEVLFQQSFFLYILTTVLSQFAFRERLAWFTILIALLHLGNIFFLDRRQMFLFFILSIPMAIGFGWLILEGLVFITVSLHLLFYLLYYGRFWFTERYHENVLFS